MMQELVVDRITEVTDKISMFTLVAAEGEALKFYKAGAHIDFDLGEVGTRSYSLVDFARPSPVPAFYNIAVQLEEEGQGGSRAMHALSVGDKIKVSDPKNDFELHDTDGPTLLIAGGIGVTPIISFASKLQDRSAGFSLHYAVRNVEVMPFRNELREVYGDALTIWYDDEAMIDIDQLVKDAAPDTHIYCCGPRGMIEAVRERAEAQGFGHDYIHFELFASPSTHEGDQPFEVEIADGRVFLIPEDKTIVEVLEENDVDVMYDCSRGDCGICQTDVVSGEPDHRDVVLSDAERTSGKVMQICVSRAKSARLVLDI